ncbi:hypothetical protein [Methanolobus sp. WCC5]|uniref:hypothetical protein n=1 Tax=Methanolobus sp. WCC5 TaxID=3125785 RepID=UPI00324D76BD
MEYYKGKQNDIVRNNECEAHEITEEYVHKLLINSIKGWIILVVDDHCGNRIIGEIHPTAPISVPFPVFFPVYMPYISISSNSRSIILLMSVFMIIRLPSVDILSVCASLMVPYWSHGIEYCHAVHDDVNCISGLSLGGCSVTLFLILIEMFKRC